MKDTIKMLKNLDAYEIQKYQRNRYPCLFIDFVEEVVPGKYAKGYKHFTYNEWFFPCHFEDEPVVPGFVLIEMMNQMFLMTCLSFDDTKGKKAALLKAKNIQCKKKIQPGMKLDITATCKSYSRGVAKGNVVATVNDELVCSSEVVIGIPDIIHQFKPKKQQEFE